MPRCAGVKPDGSPCERIVGASQRYCYSHDESRARDRSAAASKAAKAKATNELVELKAKLKELLNAVVEGKLEKGKGSVAAQLAGVLIRAVEEERKVLETVELEERITALERSHGSAGSGRRGRWVRG